MSSWAGNRAYAPQKKKQEAISYFQTTQDEICLNFNLLFSAFFNATKTSSPLYVHDTPNSISDTFPLFQSILQTNSTIKYVKEIPENSNPYTLDQIRTNPFLQSTNMQTLKRNAQTLFYYNGETQEKIMTRIRSAGIDRTLFDVGVYIPDPNPFVIDAYVQGLQTFARRLGKTKLSVFVVSDDKTNYDDLKAHFPTWTFFTFQSGTQKKEEAFYKTLTDLHILQNLPNLLVSLSTNLGRFVYLTSRVSHTSDTLISLDSSTWSLF